MRLACTALRQGECDLAVSGSIGLLLSPGTGTKLGDPVEGVALVMASRIVISIQLPGCRLSW